MNKVFFTHDQIQERPNSRYDAPDPFQIHYHFRPARPANLCVTRDRRTGRLNVSAGTLGPLTWTPYTMCLHIAKGSPHTYRNLEVGGHCVIALPGRNLVKETWITALPLPDGINELEAAGMHEAPSTLIDIPGVAECPVNFECVVEFKQDYYTHGIVFVRVLGASIDEEVLGMSREEAVHYYPTYEVDDVANRFGGSIERLGLMGDIIACPAFPSAPKEGWYQPFPVWMSDLAEEGYLSAPELAAVLAAHREYDALYAGGGESGRLALLRELFTRLPGRIIEDDWNGVHRLLAGL